LLAKCEPSEFKGVLDIAALPGGSRMITLSEVDGAFRVRSIDAQGELRASWLVPDRLRPFSSLFLRGATLRLLAQAEDLEVYELTFGVGPGTPVTKSHVMSVLKFNERLDAALLATLRKALLETALTPVPLSTGSVPDRETVLLNYPLLTGDPYFNRLAFSPRGDFFAIARTSSDLLDVAWADPLAGKYQKVWRTGLREAAGLGDEGTRITSIDVGDENRERCVVVGVTRSNSKSCEGSVLWLQAKEGLPVLRNKTGLLAHRIPSYPSAVPRR
jgi:hypothetical protein